MASIRTTQIGDILEIKKECAISNLSAYAFLKPSHPLSPYGVANLNDIIPPGTQLTVTFKGLPNTKYRQSYVTVDCNGKTFDIFANYLRRFCK